MTALDTPAATRALRRAAIAAATAPSIHNSQPWRFVLADGELEIHSDASRRLQALDPYGRQLMLSCGCALLNARATLAAAGTGVAIQRLPDPGRPGLLARLAAAAGRTPDDSLVALAPAIEQRRTNRRAFSPEPVPAGLVTRLVAAASAEGARLGPVPAEAIPAVVALARLAAPARADEPAYPAAADPDQTLLVLGTDEDNPAAWLRGGEALERILLEVAAQGWAVSLYAEVVEDPRANAQLREHVWPSGYPQLMLRVGRAPSTPATRRRRLVDVLGEPDEPRRR